MRRQLIAALAGLAILVMALYIGPRTFLTASIVRDHQQELIDRSADLIAGGLNAQISNGIPPERSDVERLVRAHQRITVDLRDGPVIRAGTLDADTETYAARRVLFDGSTLAVELSSESVEEQVRSSLTPIVVLAAVAILVAVFGAVALARRLVRPFEDLAEHASDLAIEEQVAAPRSGMPEADALADALDRRRDHVRELLRRERQFSANASHQLRTPLSALRLRLEDLTRWDETEPVVGDELVAAIGEVDRLAATISDLLELARLGGIGAWNDVDVVVPVSRSWERWEPIFAGSGRQVVFDGPQEAVVAPTSARGLQQILDVLLDNALEHGTGSVTLQVHRGDDAVLVRVADEGTLDRSDRDQAIETMAATHRSSSGIGLALAQTIAETAGARIAVASTHPTVFEVRLPLTDAPALDPAGVPV
jgi:signal transduction histidine kinase